MRRPSALRNSSADPVGDGAVEREHGAPPVGVAKFVGGPAAAQRVNLRAAVGVRCLRAPVLARLKK